jgi:hypothetical protein
MENTSNNVPSWKEKKLELEVFRKIHESPENIPEHTKTKAKLYLGKGLAPTAALALALASNREVVDKNLS